MPQGGPQAVPHYSSPPQRVRSWRADRPGDLPTSPLPSGGGYGHQGPDQGYALNLAKRFIPILKLQPGESVNDVVAGCVTVALKRASLFGRAPLAEDLRVAFAHWGFLDDSPLSAGEEVGGSAAFGDPAGGGSGAGASGASAADGGAPAARREDREEDGKDVAELAAGAESPIITDRRALFAGAGGHDGYACRSRIADSVSPSELGVPAALCGG